MKKFRNANHKAGVNPEPTREAYDVFLSPVVTEKTAGFELPNRQRVTFKVPQGATKPVIKDAVKRVFGVEVESVRTVNVQGKVMRSMRGVGRRIGYKKAYITLKPGQNIDVVEGV